MGFRVALSIPSSAATLLSDLEWAMSSFPIFLHLPICILGFQVQKQLDGSPRPSSRLVPVGATTTQITAVSWSNVPGFDQPCI